MSDDPTAVSETNAKNEFSWSWSWIKIHPVRFIGIFFNILFRVLFGLFFLQAGINKIQNEWVGTDLLQEIFLQRLTELDPTSFAYTYLVEFGLPLYPLIAWVVTVGELVVGVGLIFGIATRLSSFGAFFILFNFAIGGYYDASLLPFFLLSIVFMLNPTGHYLGFGGMLKRRFPRYGPALI